MKFERIFPYGLPGSALYWKEKKEMENTIRGFVKSLKEKDFTQEDIQEIVRWLEDNIEFGGIDWHLDPAGEVVGKIVGYCINKSKEEEIKIDLRKDWNYLPLDVPKGRKVIVKGNIGYLGTLKEGGEIEIDGYCYEAGRFMEDGTIKVKKASHVGEEMEGGKIYVGKALKSVGRKMRGGKIYVERFNNYFGDPYPEIIPYIHYISPHTEIGFGMRGGEIHLEQDPRKLPRDCLGYDATGGRIYFQYELIVENGRRVDGWRKILRPLYKVL